MLRKVRKDLRYVVLVYLNYATALTWFQQKHKTKAGQVKVCSTDCALWYVKNCNQTYLSLFLGVYDCSAFTMGHHTRKVCYANVLRTMSNGGGTISFMQLTLSSRFLAHSRKDATAPHQERWVCLCQTNTTLNLPLTVSFSLLLPIRPQGEHKCLVVIYDYGKHVTHNCLYGLLPDYVSRDDDRGEQDSFLFSNLKLSSFSTKTSNSGGRFERI